MTTSSRAITILGARPNHPRKPERSYITLDLVLSYLKGEPVEQIEISPYVARRLAEDLLVAARIVEQSWAEDSRPATSPSTEPPEE